MSRDQNSGRGRTGSRLGAISRFWRNRSGAFAMQFALMVVPLVICTGLAIDGGRSFLARYELESALDAAALAVGSTTGDSTALNALARKYVDANFKAPDTTPVVLDLDPTSERVTLTGTTQLSTYFMPLIGMPTVTISANSEVRRGGSNVEVGLSLDITGSMGSKTDSNSRISTLIRASNNLIDTVVGDVQTPWFSKVAIVPWANNVKVGGFAAALRGPTSGSAITAAGWRSFGPQTVSAITWKKGGPFNVSGATWKDANATAVVATSNGVMRITSGTNKNRVQVTLKSNTTFAFANSDYISFSGLNGDFGPLNGVIYRVSDWNSSAKTLLLKNAANSAYITYSSSMNSATAGSVSRCLNTSCQWLISTSAANGLAVGDYVNIQNTLSGLNTAANAPIQVASIPAASSTAPAPMIPANSFFVPGTTPSTNLNAWSSGGTITECFTSTCEYQVTTTGSHTYANSERIYLTGATWSSGASPTVNNTVGATWSISGAGVNTFILPGISGPTYSVNYNANTASVSVCYTSTCEIQVTAAAHGIAANDKVYITGVVGMTGSSPSINTYNAWTATNVTTNTFTLSGSLGPNYTAWSSGGMVWCLNQGCEYYRYTAADGSNQIRQISDCVTERTGADAYTETAPGTSYLGDDYPVGGNNSCAGDTNLIVPLTASKTTLHDRINAMTVNGSTAGQIGVGWGWYMLSPNFASVWPNVENRPLAYDTPHLTKVMVLMTDGDFNIAHCNGVVANDYSNSTGSNLRINCNATNGSPYTNAQTICTNMRTAGVVVFTVGFQVAANSAADNFLKACATDIGHYYLASNNTQLEQAFASIATNISQLRIAH